MFGIGAVGSLIVKALLEKEGARIVAAIDVAPGKLGKDLGELLSLKSKLGIPVSDDVDRVLSKADADVAVHATGSYLKDTFPQIASIVKHGVDVVSTCEELSYPYYSEPQLAKKLDALAKENKATVLGTGINPGFLMDTLVLTLTAPCQKIEKIEAVRVMNAATRRVPFQKKIGAGLTRKEFEEAIKNKKITGHVGLEQSIAMIAEALKWNPAIIRAEAVEPVLAEKPVQSRDIRVKVGGVAGLKQKTKAILNGKEVISLDFQAYIGAKEEYDRVIITGIPNVNQKIRPCVHGDIGTVAMIVNAIPRVINAKPGLVTMKDLPIPSAAPEHLGNYVVRSV